MNVEKKLLAPATMDEQLSMAPHHPVVKRTICLPSPPLTDACDEVLTRIIRRQIACPFVGPPRFGKTKALTYIERELNAVMPGVLVVKFVASSLRARSSASFHDHIFTSLGGVIEARRADPSRSLQRAANRLIVDAHSKGSDQVVLLIDEFGRLTKDELTYLADLTNRVAEQSIRTTTVVFGSTEVTALYEALKLIGRTDLIGRFLIGIRTFRGLATELELRAVMKLYDDPEKAEYPPGSGWSLSRFFWPAAVGAGFRFEDHSVDAWEAFAKAAHPNRDFEVGAEYWSLAIGYVMMATINFAITSTPFLPEIWEDAVRESGFKETLDVTYFPTERNAA